ncbi:flagellar hook-length control protein FliK [Sporosarcina sp. ACRSM]|uniref:flagellar hook-length control protein FliK n=1 Tax=Sporosarcina sp. ACRSM TaxID=2918216 RepID=UPI001EF6B02A|nr:flagellar hook-length control protein FliK [Sporosarcina sp. ACRSM]
MNIAALQTMIGMHVQNKTTNVQTSQTSGQTFGSVFGSLAVNNPQANMSDVQPVDDTTSDETIIALLNATTIEELEVIAGELGDESEEGNLQSVTHLGDINQLAEQLHLDTQQLMESLSQLLENAGQSEVELVNLSDVWTVLDRIDKIAPTFFKDLTDALGGKGAISKQQAAELLTLLKAMELIAPKTDLLLKQEQQVFALQIQLSAAREQVETNLHAKNQSKQPLFSLPEQMHPVRVTARIDASQSMKEDGSVENGEKQTIRQTTQQTSPLSTSSSQKVLDETTMKVGQDSLTSVNQSKETSQQAVNSTIGTVAVAKGEFAVTELENHTRSEALIREMQTIFKRSNFGQTGGTNRLLIKLYPEHLGQVRIELLQTNGVMTARILASTALGKEMLDSQLHQLRQAFVQQNIQIDRIDISQTLQDTARNDREQAFNQQFGRQQQEAEQQHNQNSEEDKTFQEYMIELEV